MLLLIVIFALFVNAVSFTYCVSDYEKKVIVSESKTELPKVYLLCGLGARCRETFEHVEFPGYEKIYLEYSWRGFSPIAAGVQLSSLASPGDMVCGVSIGARAIVCSLVAPERTLLINPCVNSEVLQPKLRKLIRTYHPVLALIESVLGWICVLPIVPMGKGNFQRPTVLMDQLYWVGHDPEVIKYYTPYALDKYKAGVVLSLGDEFLDNYRIRDTMPQADFATVDCFHARIGDPDEALGYQRAINSLLR